MKPPGQFRTVLGLLSGLFLVLLLAAHAHATLIDFEGLPFTLVGPGDIVPNPASVLDDEFASVGVLFGKAGVSAGVAVVQDSFAPSSGVNSAAGLNAAGIIPGSAAGGCCVGDIFFSFLSPGTGMPAATDFVSFTVGDAGGDVDVFEIRAYNLADVLISIQNLAGAARLGVMISLAGIHRVEVDFTGDFGYSLDDLSFNLPVAAPEPATLILLGFGLTGLGLSAMRRSRAIH